MPNHITNRLRVLGNSTEVDKVFDYIKKDGEEVTIDFNTITPQPDWVYQGSLSSKEEKKYGENNCWYEWRRENWGTKWNAYNIDKNRSEFNSIYFDTAWNPPIKLIKKLSLIFEETLFQFSWASEDTGYNVGDIFIKCGSITDKIEIKEETENAIRFAKELKGSDYLC